MPRVRNAPRVTSAPNPQPIIRRTQTEITQKIEQANRCRDDRRRVELWEEIATLTRQLADLLRVVYRREALRENTRAKTNRPINVPSAGIIVPRDSYLRIVGVRNPSRYLVEYLLGEKIIHFDINPDYLEPIIGR